MEMEFRILELEIYRFMKGLYDKYAPRTMLPIYLEVDSDSSIMHSAAIFDSNQYRIQIGLSEENNAPAALNDLLFTVAHEFGHCLDHHHERLEVVETSHMIEIYFDKRLFDPLQIRKNYGEETGIFDSFLYHKEIYVNLPPEKSANTFAASVVPFTEKELTNEYMVESYKAGCN